MYFNLVFKQVGDSRLLMSTVRPTDRPTSSPTDLAPAQSYYAYRLTRPHLEWEKVRTIITKYSHDWLVGLHFPDEEELECQKEHYHFIFRDLDIKRVDAMKKCVATTFQAKGNGLHAGAWRDNHVSRAVGYIKHDERVTFYHSEQEHWPKLIEDAEVFEKRPDKRPRLFKEKLSDPQLTYANLLKQALKYQQEYMATETSLRNVLSRMVNQGSWVPSRELLKNGVPREMHEMFLDRLEHKARTYVWMEPHVLSEKAREYANRPDTTPIVSSVFGTCPADSKKMWKDACY